MNGTLLYGCLAERLKMHSHAMHKAKGGFTGTLGTHRDLPPSYRYELRGRLESPNLFHSTEVLRI